MCLTASNTPSRAVTKPTREKRSPNSWLSSGEPNGDVGLILVTVESEYKDCPAGDRERPRMLTRQIMRMLGAAIVLIVLAFASSSVQAHSGHAHDPAAQTAAQVESPELARQVTPAAFQRAVERPEAPASPNRGCISGCCSTACAACSAAGLPNSGEVVPVPPIGMVRVAVPRSPTLAGRAPESIRRPPKSFI